MGDVAEAGLLDAARRGLEPALGPLEATRRRRLGQFWRYLLLGLAGTVALVAIALWLDPTGSFTVFAGIVGLIVTGVVAFTPGRHFAREASELVMPAVCRAIGDLEHQRQPDFDLGQFTNLHLTPSHSRATVEDGLRGRHRGTEFALAEATLTRRTHSGKRTRTTTVFRGLLIRIAVPQRFTGRLLLTGDFGRIINAMAAWFSGDYGLDRVTIAEDPAFEERFQVFADSPETVRALLTPGLRQSLLALGAEQRSGSFRAAFADGWFWVAWPTGRDSFEPASLFRSTATIAERLPNLLREVTLVHRLIDLLHGDRPASVA